uniref:AIG1-type G domain-containing protein n=1 Tax=Astyanax mexicanus TaxID=7994 RepID=A0A3B1K6V2_ASTMX
MSDSEKKTGHLTKYILKYNSNNLIQEMCVERRITGEKEKSKPHKTILMVGATGTGKSTLINAIVNYMLGVEFNDRIWCEIIETKENQTDSQTKTVTVYDMHAEEHPFSLTVIDTPGYGSTEGIKEDFKTAETLNELFKSNDGVHEIDVVCLVVSSANVRLTQEQLYIFDAILSLFGKDMEKNITVLITRSPNRPINAIKAIKESNVKCAKRADGEPVYFRFDYSYCEAMNENFEDEEYEEEYEKSWNLSQKNMKSFFAFLEKVTTTDLTLTVSVLGNRKQLISCINKFKMQIEEKEKQKNILKLAKTALEQHEKEKKDNNDFEYEVDEPYKEKVLIESSWWHLNKEATCCSVCEENCHYPGCWWVRDLRWCSVMSDDGKCTLCTRRCNYTEHVKEGKMYILKTRKVKKTYEDLKKKYEKELGEKMSLKNCLEKDIENNEKEKARLVEQSYQCVLILEKDALKSETVSTLLHLDFLIEKMKETNNKERVDKLEDIKKKCEDACKGLLDYVRPHFE